MDSIARDAYALSHLIALACLIYGRWWSRYPVLLIYVVVGSILGVTYNPLRKQWIADYYMRLEPFAVLLRFLCSIEALQKVARGTPSPKRMILGGAMIGGCFALLLIVIEPGSEVLTFVMIRRYAQIGTAIHMLTGLILFQMFGILRWNLDGKHALILFALLLKQAVYSVLSMRGMWWSKSEWIAADSPGLLITSLCLLLWSWIAIDASSRSSQHFAERGNS